MRISPFSLTLVVSAILLCFCIPTSRGAKVPRSKPGPCPLSANATTDINTTLVAEALHALYPDSRPTLAELSSILLTAQAFLWAFPLVNTAPNFIRSGFGASASTMNIILWQHLPNNASFGTIATPGVDFLYGPGFFDLTQGPVNILVPDTAGRYYVLQAMSMWGLTFGRIGFTVTGTRAGAYTLIGPDYTGPLLGAATTLQSPTNGAWIMGRIAVINQNQTDIAIAAALLGGFMVSAPAIFASPSFVSPIFEATTRAAGLWGKFVASPLTQQWAFWEAYSTMAALNPPEPEMMESLVSLAPAGVTDITAQGIDWANLTSIQKIYLSLGSSVGWWILRSCNEDGATTNSTSQLITYTGWSTLPHVGSSNVSAGVAAFVSYAYGPENVPAEAVYWKKSADNCGDALVIGKSYVFNVTTRPPYNAFWSLTVYNATTHCLVDTTNNTYALGSQFPGVVTNAAGGATLFLSQAAPAAAGLRSNWLPLGAQGTAATDELYLVFRIYAPVSGGDVIFKYAPPAVIVTDAGFNPIAC